MYRFTLFTTAFRIFFLAAGLHALFVILVWILKLRGIEILTTGPSAVYWHTYEMVYGFCRAAIFGFLFTAGQHWCGKQLLTSRSMAVLFGLWLAGRLAFFVTGHMAHVVFAADVLAGFYAAGRAWPLMHPQQKHNHKVVYMLILLTLTQTITAAAILMPELSFPVLHGVRTGLMITVAFVIVIGGRILPFFTSMAIPEAKPQISPTLEKWIFPVSVTSILAFALLPVHELLRFPVALVLLAGAAINGVRWVRWRPLASLKKPILAVLFAGYLWVVVGFTMLAVMLLAQINPSPAWHVLGIGAAGVFIYGMMTRVALGHTGRKIQASAPIAVGYLLLNIALLLRVVLALTGMLPQAYLYSAILWLITFVVFVAIYSSVLWSPRVDNKPG